MSEIKNIELNLYDEAEYVFGADLEILRNSITGEISIGWAPIGSPISNSWRASHDDSAAD